MGPTIKNPIAIIEKNVPIWAFLYDWRVYVIQDPHMPINENNKINEGHQFNI